MGAVVPEVAGSGNLGVREGTWGSLLHWSRDLRSSGGNVNGSEALGGSLENFTCALECTVHNRSFRHKTLLSGHLWCWEHSRNMETLFGGPEWMLREHLGILEGRGDTKRIYGGRQILVVLWSAGHDGGCSPGSNGTQLGRKA